MVFTGIIEEVGIINRLSLSGHSGKIDIRARKVLTGTKIGDSIAVNGVCLTVTDLTSDGFIADVMPETVNRSSLGILNAGSMVNLERAMPIDGRFGGHIVSGHIDGIGIIKEIYKDENAVRMTITTDDDILLLIVEKGSISIDGISLTVASLGEDFFQISVIPHTLNVTSLLKKRQGDPVNLETDIIGKYVQKLFNNNTKDILPDRDELTIDYLREMGF